MRKLRHRDEFFTTAPSGKPLKNILKTCCCCCCIASVMSDSVRPQRWQPTRLPHPWDPPGKNTGVGCHFLLQCMKVKSESEVAQSCLIPSDPMDCSLPGSSVHGILQTRILEWVAMPSSRGSSTPRDQTWVENPRDGGAWWAPIYGVAQSRT